MVKKHNYNRFGQVDYTKMSEEDAGVVMDTIKDVATTTAHNGGHADSTLEYLMTLDSREIMETASRVIPLLQMKQLMLSDLIMNRLNSKLRPDEFGETQHLSKVDVDLLNVSVNMMGFLQTFKSFDSLMKKSMQYDVTEQSQSIDEKLKETYKELHKKYGSDK
jgi:hypothetical protein